MIQNTPTQTQISERNRMNDMNAFQMPDISIRPPLIRYTMSDGAMPPAAGVARMRTPHARQISWFAFGVDCPQLGQYCLPASGRTPQPVHTVAPAGTWVAQVRQYTWAPSPRQGDRGAASYHDRR